MPAILRSGLRAFIVIAILSLSAIRSYGSHIFGVDMYYTHVAGNTYTIHLVIYGDCSGAAIGSLPTSTPVIGIYNGDTHISDVTLGIVTPSAGVEVTPVCASEASNTTCTNPSSAIPGIKKFVYTANVTLSGTSTVWRFLFTGNMGGGSLAGRSNSITNITIPPLTGSLIQLVDTLNNTTYDNSNAVYNTIPTPFFCINVPANFNPAAVDPDGDSLVFYLVPAIDGNTGSSVSYISPYTATAPLGVTAGTFTFGSATGQLSFTPNIVQKGLVVYNVEEYHAGVLRGTSQREMSVVVLSPCTTDPPTGEIGTATAGTIVDSTQFEVCGSVGAFSFHIDPTDAGGDTIKMTVSGLPTGATLNVVNNNTPAPLGTFSWNTTGITPGNYTFFVTYQNDGCPLSSTQTLAYTITIYPVPTVAYALVSPATCIKKAVFQVTPGGAFSPYSVSITEGAASVGSFSGVTGAVADSLLPGTYTIYAYNPDACYADTTITIASPTLPKPTVSTTPPLCPGGATGAATISGSLGLAPYQYAIGAGTYGASGTFTGLTPGVYTLHVKDANGCIKDTIIAVANATPILMNIGIQKPLCNNFANGSVVINAYNSVGPYTYAIGAGAYSSTDTFAALASGTYTVEVKNANNCIVDTVLTLVDSESVSATLTAASILCYGDSATVTVNATGGYGPPYNYAYNGNPFGISDVFNFTAGTYTIHVTDPNACFFDTSITMTQPSLITIAPVVTNVTCNGAANGSVLVNASGGTPAYLYSLDGSTFAGTDLFTGLSVGEQYIQVLDANGCAYLDSAAVTEPAPLVINSVASQMPTCNAGANGTFTVTASGGTTGYTYTYNAAPYTASSVLTGLVAGTYTVYVKDANGCIQDTVLTLSQPPAIVPAALVRRPVCNTLANGQVTMSAAGGTPGYTYSQGAGAYSASGVFGPLASGTYTFNIMDANGCIKDTVITLTDSLHISGLFTITPALCYDQASGTITVNGAGGVSPYTYSIGSGIYSGTDVYTALGAGSYDIHIKDVNGCTDDTTVAVGQPTNIIPAISITQPSCYGFSDGSITISGAGGTPAYTYSFDNSAYTGTATYPGLPAGTDSVMIKDANGCLHDTTFTIGQPTQLTIGSLSWTNIKCNGGADGTITVTGAGATAPYTYAVNASAFQVSTLLTGLVAGAQVVYVKDSHGCEIDSTITLTQPAPLVFTGADTVNPTCQGYKDGSVVLHVSGGTMPYLYSIDNITFGSANAFDTLAEGTYTFYIQDADNCTNDTTITLTGLPHILIDNVSVTAPTCYGATNGTITLVASGGVPALYYTISGNPVHQPTGAFGGLNSGDYVIVITDNRNCTKDSTVEVPQPDSLSIIAAITPNECIGYDTHGGVQVTISGGTEPFTYLWSTDPVQTTSGITGLPNGAYTVWVKDANNCSDSLTVQVTYDDCCTPFIPSGFTPNNDGLDDVFRIRFKGDMTIIVFSIYNRFGQEVYTVTNTQNADQGWDGKFNGIPVELGTYYYYAKLKCGNKGDHIVELKGDVTLVR